MIQTYAHQKELHEARIDIKTLERLFANVITEGSNCSTFESDIIVKKAKEVFANGDHSESGILQPGQMIWTAIDINEPPGKPLKGSQFRRITLTHISPKEDAEVRREHGPFCQVPATNRKNGSGGKRAECPANPRGSG